jgi:hypothetical protein
MFCVLELRLGLGQIVIGRSFDVFDSDSVFSIYGECFTLQHRGRYLIELDILINLLAPSPVLQQEQVPSLSLPLP